MDRNFLALILLFCGGCFLTLGDIVMKKWVAGHDYRFYALGLAIYIGGLNFLAFSFKYKGKPSLIHF